MVTRGNLEFLRRTNALVTYAAAATSPSQLIVAAAAVRAITGAAVIIIISATPAIANNRSIILPSKIERDESGLPVKLSMMVNPSKSCAEKNKSRETICYVAPVPGP
jgi:hypothetical protein